MAKGLAFWVKGTAGILIEVKECHVKAIINHPDIFGTTTEELKSIYEEFNEVYGTEGNAREKILLKAMQAGWIRGREYYGRGNERLSIELWNLSESNQRALISIGNKILNNEIPVTLKGKYTPVSITEFWSRHGDANEVQTDKSPTGKIKMMSYKTDVGKMAQYGILDETLIPIDLVVFSEQNMTTNNYYSMKTRIQKDSLLESTQDRLRDIKRILQ